MIKKRIKEEFGVMGIESTAVMLKFIKSTDTQDYSPRSLAILGRALLSGIRRARRVVATPEASRASVETSKELIEESFNLAEDIVADLEQYHDNDEIPANDRNSIIGFMAEYIKCCSEEEQFRSEMEENRTAEEVAIAEEIKRQHDLRYPEKEDSDLILDGFEVKDIIDKII